MLLGERAAGHSSTCECYQEEDRPRAAEGTPQVTKALQRQLDWLSKVGSIPQDGPTSRAFPTIKGRAASRLPASATEVDLVSQRVGDFRFHPLEGLLLDQFWVR